MNKYAAFFCVPPATMDDWMKNTSEADRKAQTDKMMQDWQAWMTAHEAVIADKGMPLGKTKRIDQNGMSDVRNDLNFMIVVQANSPEEAAQMFVGHPHVTMIPGAYIEVMGTAGMSGM